MINRNLQGHASERPCISRISLCHSFGKYLLSLRIAIAQHHRKIFRTILVRQAHDDPLILEIHLAGGGSDEALGDLEDHLQSRAAEALGDHRSRDTVALADGDDFFSFQHSPSVNLRFSRPKTSSRRKAASFGRGTNLLWK